MQTKYFYKILFIFQICLFYLNNTLLAQQELGPSPISTTINTANISTGMIGERGLYSSAYSNKVNQVLVAPANDNCASATVLTIDAALLCSQNDLNATLQVGECYTNYSGITEVSVWYRFTATNDSLVLNFLQTNSPSGAPELVVYGPFASGAGCLPACASLIYDVVQNGDPGSHILLTGLATSGNHDYLIQVQGNQKNPSPDVSFCINLANPAVNSKAPANASIINNCGTTYNGTTNGGYWPSGTGSGFANLDANAGTTCAACVAGNDVSFVINDISWFKFCSVNAGTYNVQFNVTSCVFTGINSGSQMAVLTGTNTSLTNIWQAANPTYTNTATQTSPNFTLAAGGCAYLVVDGFAGDACSYNYVLTNVSGGCTLLPIELTMFNVHLNGNYVDLTWSTAAEINNDYFTLERSADGLNFESIGSVKGAGNSVKEIHYYFQDRKPLTGISYYRLKQTDFDKKESFSRIQSISINAENIFDFILLPNPSDKNEDIRLVFNGKENEVLNLSITDITGKLLSEKEIKLSASSLEVNLKHHFDAGIYYIKVSNKDGKIINQKFIVQ